MYLVLCEAEPHLTISKTEVTNTQAMANAESAGMLWVCSRVVNSKSDTKQTVPAWAGWVSLTGNSEGENQQLSTVDYMAPVNEPVTEMPVFSTV